MSGPVDQPNEETCEVDGSPKADCGGRCHAGCRPAPSPAGDPSEQETLWAVERLTAHGGRRNSKTLAREILAARDADLTRRAARNALLGAAAWLGIASGSDARQKLATHANDRYPETTP